MKKLRRIIGSVQSGSLLIPILLAGICSTVNALSSDAARSFATPEEAVRFLADAVASTNRSALRELFGSAAETLANPDTVQGARELAEFSQAFSKTNRLASDSDGRKILEVGDNSWPLPIPLVRAGEGWKFDTDTGVEELLNRRIGQNELDTLRVMRAFVSAQREYASEDRDNDGVLEYAQLMASSPGKTDGLFWSPEMEKGISPLGPLVAYAQAEGYRKKSNRDDAEQRPFHGYFFKMLARQGKHAPGGKYDYVINGNMIGGFALVAWPADYGGSGVMTFIVNHQGKVFERDLGKKTHALASRMTAYDPGEGWRASRD